MYMCEEGLWGGGGGGEEGARALELSGVAGGIEREGTASDEDTDNSLLGESAGGEFVDLYRLASVPTAIGGAYPVRLRESGRRRANLDQLRLGVVDREASVVAIAGAGEVHVGTLHSPESVTTEDGADLSTLAAGASEELFSTRGGQIVRVDLGASRGASAIVIESSRSSAAATADSIGILVQKSEKDGSWTTIGTVHPRRKLDQSAVLDQGSQVLRLVSLRDYNIRSIRRLDVAETVVSQMLTLASTDHSKLGSVDGAVRESGGSTTKLEPQDTLVASFTATPVPAGKVRDLFLMVKGSYETLADAPIAQSRVSEVKAVQTYEFALGQARPNPTAGSVTISYILAQETPVAIRVYDVAGRMVRTLVNETGAPGPHEVVWDARTDDGRRVSAGVYFYRMNAGAWQSQRKGVFLER
jgi:hypothetical protein